MKIYSRTAPYFSFLKEKTLLTGPGSTKKTYHLVLDASGWDGEYKVGDSIGILPSNDPQEVASILSLLRLSGKEEVFDRRAELYVPFKEFLTHRANLSRVNRSLLSLFAERGFAPIETLLETESLESRTLLEWLRVCPVSPAEVASKTMPLLPRFYSIANSRKVFGDEIHLVVGYAQYELRGETRVGVGSRFLCDLAEIGSTKIPWYVQPSNRFTLPSDPSQSIIMVGAGTGIAPYRAFMQERIAMQSLGRNWLFFGERNEATDFYYEPFWRDLEAQGHLRLDVAFSRDGESKTYVQHRMYERKKGIWNYLQEGALFYVCGDANQMAKDVDAMLHQIVQEEGSFSSEEAIAYVKTLRREGRYLIDVYS